MISYRAAYIPGTPKNGDVRLTTQEQSSLPEAELMRIALAELDNVTNDPDLHAQYADSIVIGEGNWDI